ncbi:hypothetical protein [Pseudoxanthomonas suwonensis]|uniref:hypothetical protein n=1 Tax=Pseudoxanthomonas suwonensis TaxID=314722 RepID=UPI0012DEC0E0|nr:hypothetical protein [Pseudoxanthomonas suwonensis]
MAPPSVWLAITSLFLISTVLDGPIRYFLASKSLAPIAYLPKVMMVVALLLLVPRRASLAGAALVTMAAALCTLWGSLNLSSVSQAVFGLWVLVPFLYGLGAGRYVLEEYGSYSGVLLAAFLVASAGIFLSPFVSFPWSGSEITLGGKSIQVSRQWTSMGIDRYAGFSRASYSAASQILTLSVLIFVGIKSRFLATAIWLSAGAAILMTTAKGLVAAWLVTTLFFLSGKATRQSRDWRLVWASFLLLATFLVVAVPVSTLLLQYGASNEGDSFLFGSFIERIVWMWPDSFRLLSTPAEWLFGRGAGGIGTAQQYFDPDGYRPADNIFVYSAVMLGPFAAFILLALLGKRCSSRLVRGITPDGTFPLVICIMLYGLVANVVEDSFLAFFLGACISTLFSLHPRAK